ncbi:uncharacterized protein LOC126833862 [Adelges cooleyi]|uniref:uncharacterized protein LOC126833862 n=1 Tax=Adelges cooleyi TaxID=133065 RepID=UPI00218046F6|nr:uncharacterized protein LOC126833862 [Adelges cooleyi]
MKSRDVQVTVLELLNGIDAIHVHCTQRLSVTQPRLLGRQLANSLDVLKVRKHRLFYAMAPPGKKVCPLDDACSCEAFFEWPHGVLNVYAVIVNSVVTAEYEKTVELYTNVILWEDVDRINRFKRIIAKPLSHRPMEPEIDPPDDQKPGTAERLYSKSQSSKSSFKESAILGKGAVSFQSTTN